MRVSGIQTRSILVWDLPLTYGARRKVKVLVFQNFRTDIDQSITLGFAPEILQVRATMRNLLSWFAVICRPESGTTASAAS